VKEHRIELIDGYCPRPWRHGRRAAAPRHVKVAMFHEGKSIGESYRPIEDVARYLLAEGIAMPREMIAFSRDGVLTRWSSTVGEAAKIVAAGTPQGTPRASWQSLCHRGR